MALDRHIGADKSLGSHLHPADKVAPPQGVGGQTMEVWCLLTGSPPWDSGGLQGCKMRRAGYRMRGAGARWKLSAPVH